MTLHLRSVAVAATAAALVLAACGDDGYGTSSTDAPAASTGSGGSEPAGETGVATITIQEFSFGGEIQATAGQPIDITNADGTSHTVTDEAGAFDVSVKGGESAELVIDAPGTYSIFCRIHSRMRGTIVVS